MNGWIRISPKKSSFRLATLLHCLLGPKLLPPFLIAPKLRHLLYFRSFYLYWYYNYGVYFLFLLELKLLFIYVGPKQRPPLLWSLLGPKLRPPLLFLFGITGNSGHLWELLYARQPFPPSAEDCVYTFLRRHLAALALPASYLQSSKCTK